MVQLIALTDGWVGLQEGSRIVGETFDVTNDTLNVDLAMMRTFDANIRVVDKEGKPMGGVTVACSPNQLCLKGGSSHLGQKRDSIPGLIDQIRNEIDSNIMEPPSFEGVSDRDGRLTIRNLPRNTMSSRFEIWQASRRQR